MVNTQNTMRRVRRMSRDALRGLVAAGGLCAAAGGAQAEAIGPGPGSAVAELHRASTGDVAGLVSADPEAFLGLAMGALLLEDFVAHSNNTRFVLDAPGEEPDSLGWLLDPGVRWKGLVEVTPLSAPASTVGAIPAPGALWLLALGTMCTRRRRRRA